MNKPKKNRPIPSSAKGLTRKSERAHRGLDGRWLDAEGVTVGDPIFEVGSFSVTPKQTQREDGGEYASLRIAIGPQYTELDMYEAQQLRQKIEAWYEDMMSRGAVG